MQSVIGTGLTELLGSSLKFLSQQLPSLSLLAGVDTMSAGTSAGEPPSQAPSAKGQEVGSKKGRRLLPSLPRVALDTRLCAVRWFSCQTRPESPCPLVSRRGPAALLRVHPHLDSGMAQGVLTVLRLCVPTRSRSGEAAAGKSAGRSQADPGLMPGSVWWARGEEEGPGLPSTPKSRALGCSGPGDAETAATSAARLLLPSFAVSQALAGGPSDPGICGFTVIT